MTEIPNDVKEHFRAKQLTDLVDAAADLAAGGDMNIDTAIAEAAREVGPEDVLSALIWAATLINGGNVKYKVETR